jgi:hypothetical protein
MNSDKTIMSKVRSFLPWLLLLLAACSQDPGSGPVEVKWDRDACEHCRMVLSDRYYAAEIRGGPRKEVFKFDDLGCALEWLEKQTWPDREQAEIWVTDYQTGAWLNARQAYYHPGRITPMDYGLGASAQPAPGSLSFSEARARILTVGHRHSSPREP